MFIRGDSHVEFVENHVDENEQSVARVKQVRSCNGYEEDNIHIVQVAHSRSLLDQKSS